MKKVIVTGANGFVGKNLIPMLLNKNYFVYAFVQKNTVLNISNENLKCIYIDLLNFETLNLIELLDIDYIFNFAWVGVSTKDKNNLDLQIKNIKMTENIIEFANKIKCKKIIFPGSTSEFAYAEKEINGKQQESPSDIYAATKIAVRYYAKILCEKYQLHYNWIFIPSVYGPGRDDSNIITYTIKTILNNEDAHFTKLEQRWDYIFIDDLVCSIISVAETGKDNKNYVTGSGYNRPLKEYIEIIRDCINPSFKLGVGDLPYKTHQVDNSIVDLSEITLDTGYKPKFSFIDGIQLTIEYYKNKKD